jgi:flagellar biosynthesis protein FliR
VISAFAASLDSYPPGNFTVSQDFAKTVVQLGASLFSTGLRLAFPVIGLLLMTDISLGVLGRINTQLQMGGNAFPVKMLLTLVMLAAVVAVAPSLYEAYSSEVFRTIRATFVH